MITLDQMAKAAHDAMVSRYLTDDETDAHRWEQQSEQCREDWRAAIRAALAVTNMSTAGTLYLLDEADVTQPASEGTVTKELPCAEPKQSYSP